jgi:saccharopine dehydrogenase (NADP+, L-glutamate forming)
MKQILLIGAGLSTGSLISYLLKNADAHDWHIRIGDQELDIINKKINGHPRAEGFILDVNNQEQLYDEVQKADMVISMLPARFHYLVAEACVALGKNMATASYATPEIKKLDEKAKEKGVAIMMELGVDPGIDHMSAMQIIDNIKEQGGKITLFKSFTGGLVAPKYDNNPWNYKFTWNPRNVVVAGQGVSQFIRNGRYKYIPYTKLFSRTERVFFDEVGEFEGYANRDSLSYRKIYGIDDIPTIFRGTLRRPGFCKSWNVFVQLGMTDDTYYIENLENMTYRDFINAYLPYDATMSAEEKVSKMFDLPEDSSVLYRLRWLGLFEDKKIGLIHATPAQVLQHLLEKKWALDEGDKDMLAMQHQFEYELNGETKRLKSSLVVYGSDTETAMSLTVGTPLGIAVKLLLSGEIKAQGVTIPVTKNIYEPILKELKEYGIAFNERIY